jgi:cephalosporin hydroxylase
LYDRPDETWKTMTWLGVPLLQQPMDLYMLQELVCTLIPDWIVETGTFRGGSALFLAHLLEYVNPYGGVITIDCEARDDRPDHDRIEYVTGNSVAPETVAHVAAILSSEPGPTLVLLDSDHSAAHVLAELRAYSPLVTPGSYLIVEDTNLNGHPVVPGWGPGPAEGLAQWLIEDRPPFEADRWCERLGVTFWPGGWLRRLEAP